MIPKKPVPDLDPEGGTWFWDKIRRKNKNV
jgi:hypothetical protein